MLSCFSGQAYDEVGGVAGRQDNPKEKKFKDKEMGGKSIVVISSFLDKWL